MKWIKSYKLFESVNEDDISDILLELVDEGFKVDHSDPYLNVDYFPLSENHISFVNTAHQKAFKWGIAKDAILRLVDYLGDNMIKIKINTPNKGFLKNLEDLNSLSDDNPIIAIRIFYKIESNYWRIKTGDESKIIENLSVVKNYDFIKLDKNEIHTIDDLLEPNKSYYVFAGHHSNDPDYIRRITEYEWSTFGRSVVFYPQGDNPNQISQEDINRIVTGYRRGGYTWFTNATAEEISVNKFNNGLFLVVFKNAGFSTAFFAKDLDAVVSLIRKYV
jgi:hypothetical protein